GLGRADALEEHRVRHELGELLLDARREDGGGAADDADVRRVVAALPELGEERAGEGIADDRELVDLLAHDRLPDALRVEPADLVGEDDDAAAVERVEGAPLPRAVHERRQDDETATEPRVDVAQELLV